MADETQPLPTPPFPERRTQARATDNALAQSSPDPTVTLMRIVRWFMKTRTGRVFAGVIVLIWVVAQFGVNALLASIPIMDKWLDFRKWQVQFQAEQSIGQDKKLDQVLQNTEQTNLTVRALGEDVQRIDQRVQKIEDAHAKGRAPESPERP